MFQKQETFTLKNFEGPIDFLLCLIQKEEINIYDVSIRELTEQFLLKLTEWKEKQIETGAEFIGTAAYLVWLKSKTLLPIHDENDLLPPEEEDDPNFEIIHHLIDYCRFKQVAKDLAKRQDEQNQFFFRGLEHSNEWKKPMGIDHLSLDELSLIFKDMLERSSTTLGKIHEENWRVSDKIRDIRQTIKMHSTFNINSLFTGDKSKLEWIVIFLALLELIKIGEIGIGREIDTQSILVYAKKEGA